MKLSNRECALELLKIKEQEESNDQLELPWSIARWKILPRYL